MQKRPSRKDAKAAHRPEHQARKRKRSQHRSSLKDKAQQQTLQSLLAAPQVSESGEQGTSTGDSPHSKRLKPTQTTSASHNQPLVSSQMYSFSSRHTASSSQTDAIDLTKSSPPVSPTARRVNGAINPALSRHGLNSHTGARKLVVKNLKQNTGWDGKAYLEKIWTQADAALAVVFEDADGSLGNSFSKEDLYRGVENVCRQGGARTFFDRLESKCREHIHKDILQPLQKGANADNVDVLRSVLEKWRMWKAQMSTVTAIFFFMDRSYLLSSSKPTLGELTPQLFRDIIFTHPFLKSKIIDGTCELVAQERTGQHQLDAPLFEQAVQMLRALSVYTAAFEPRFLGLAQQYLLGWSDEAAASEEVRNFVQQAEKMMVNEISRCEKFALDGSTKRELLALLEEHLISRKEAYLTNPDALADLLDDNAIDDIAALYTLLEKRRLGNKLRPGFDKWIDLAGTAIVFADDPSDMVTRLLSLKRALDLTWRIAFQQNTELGHGLRESFAIFINKTKKTDGTWGTDNTKVGEMIAKYVDQVLRGGVKAIPEVLNTRRASSMTQPGLVGAALRRSSTMGSAEARHDSTGGTTEAIDDNEDIEVDEDTEVNVQLEQVLDLFRFLEGKAVFEAFYKKDLARRLLMGRSASADAERSMLAKLKTECGSGFTQNLEQMFKDVELAREELQSYKSRLEDRIGNDYKAKQLDLDVKILSAAAWPTYPDIAVRIPTNIQRAIEDFEMHYKSKHNGRKLDWKHALAHCQMRASFGPKSNKELVVSSFQAIVLLLFNGLSEDTHLTYQHVLSETGLPAQEVKRTLQSLACAKLRPLTKHPKGRDVNETDTFTINTSFEHPKYRIKINQVQLKETKEENKETHIRVAEDRNFECQAAIVRIMKARKMITHAELISEVIEATRRRGVMSVADIKKNIDRLIEKEYMQREDGNKYSYVA